MSKIWLARKLPHLWAHTLLRQGAGKRWAQDAAAIEAAMRIPNAGCSRYAAWWLMMNSQEMKPRFGFKLHSRGAIIGGFRLWHDPVEAGVGSLPIRLTLEIRISEICRSYVREGQGEKYR